MKEWLVVKLKFVNFYFWKIFKGEYEMNLFISYMEAQHHTLWYVIVKTSINASCTLLPPKKETLPPPMFVGSNILDCHVIDLEILECQRLLGLGKPSLEMSRDINKRVFAACGHNAPPF